MNRLTVQMIFSWKTEITTLTPYGHGFNSYVKSRADELCDLGKMSVGR